MHTTTMQSLFASIISERISLLLIYNWAIKVFYLQPRTIITVRAVKCLYMSVLSLFYRQRVEIKNKI